MEEDWTLPKEWREFALTLGLDQTMISWEEAKFLDYWTALSGAKATKVNWLATWRNWCRRCVENQKRTSRYQAPAVAVTYDPTFHDLDRALTDEAVRLGVWKPLMDRTALELAVKRARH